MSRFIVAVTAFTTTGKSIVAIVERMKKERHPITFIRIAH
jgi:hypothetical protein